MDKTYLKKNRLDNEYKFESQKALIFLSIGTISLISFITITLLQKLYVVSIIFSITIVLYASIFYYKTKSKMNRLLHEIENIKTV